MRYALDVLIWVGCWAAHWFIRLVPMAARKSLLGRAWWGLLPYAGYYAFHEPWMNWRWSQRPAGPDEPDAFMVGVHGEDA